MRTEASDRVVQADLHELILIGCDRPEDAGGIARAASMLGWHTRLVPGIRALGDLASAADTIAVVCDGGNGRECGDVARELRELHHDLPIIVVSSNSSHRFIVGVL